jgi:hypothetical protein
MDRRRKRLVFVVGGAFVVGIFVAWNFRSDADRRSPPHAATPVAAESRPSAAPREAAPSPRAGFDEAQIPPGACRFRFRVVYDDGSPLAHGEIEVGPRIDEPSPSPVWAAIERDRLIVELDALGFGESPAPIGASAMLASAIGSTRQPRFAVPTAVRCDEIIEVVVPARKVFTLSVFDEALMPAAGVRLMAKTDGDPDDYTEFETGSDGRAVLRGCFGKFVSFLVMNASDRTPSYAMTGAAEGAIFNPEHGSATASLAAGSCVIRVRRDQVVKGRVASSDELATSALDVRVFVEVEGHVGRVELPVEVEFEGRFSTFLRRDGRRFAFDAKLARASVEATFGGATIATASIDSSTAETVDFGDVPITHPPRTLRLRCVDERGFPADAAPFCFVLAEGSMFRAPYRTAIDDPDEYRTLVPRDAAELFVGGEDYAVSVVPTTGALDEPQVVRVERRATIDFVVQNARYRDLTCRVAFVDEATGAEEPHTAQLPVVAGRASFRPHRLGTPMRLTVLEAVPTGAGAPTVVVVSSTPLAPAAPGETRLVTIDPPLARTGLLAGRVEDGDGAPIPHALVEITVEPDLAAEGGLGVFRASTWCDETGWFEARGLPFGRGTARHAGPGLVEASADFDMKEESADVILALSPHRIARAEFVGFHSLSERGMFVVTATTEGKPGRSLRIEPADDEDPATFSAEVAVAQGSVVRFSAKRDGVEFHADARPGEPPPRVDVSGTGTAAFEKATPTTAEDERNMRVRSVEANGVFGAYEELWLPFLPITPRVERVFRPGEYELATLDGRFEPIRFVVHLGRTTRVVLPR